MNLIVHPVRALRGTIRLPASKSYSIRAFLIAACGGRSLIRHPSLCDDARVAMRVAGALGCVIKKISAGTWSVQARRKRPRLERIEVGESGTVLRFLLPLVALFGDRAVITGKGTLRGRPNHLLSRVLREHGVDIRGQGKAESIPLRYHGGIFSPGEIRIPGGLSSQFISALLIACPQLSADSVVRIAGRTMVSTDYVTMTRQVLRAAGVRIRQVSSRVFAVPGKQTFRGLQDFTVPSDYGLAAFLLGAAALVPSRIRLTGHFDPSLIQADGAILDLLRRLGARFRAGKNAIEMTGPWPLKGGEFCLKDCPDLVPVMAVLGLFAKGRTKLYGIGHARLKEADRIGDLARELAKIGARVRQGQNELMIFPQDRYRSDVLLDPHRDHRLAMAFSLIGLKMGVRVKDIECVAKSYPDFVKDMKAIGAGFRVQNENRNRRMK